MSDPDTGHDGEAAALRRLAYHLTDVELWLGWRHRTVAVIAARVLDDGRLAAVACAVARDDPATRRRAAEDCARALKALGHVLEPRAAGIMTGVFGDEGPEASAHCRLATMGRVEGALAAAGIRLPLRAEDDG